MMRNQFLLYLSRNKVPRSGKVKNNPWNCSVCRGSCRTEPQIELDCNFKNLWGNRLSNSDICFEFQSTISITYTTNPSPPSLVAFQSWAIEFPMQDTSVYLPKRQWTSKENLSNFSSAFNSKNIFRLWILLKVVEDGPLHSFQ